MKKNKLSILRKEFRIYNIDGYIIPKNDEFFGEYVDPSNERLKYLTGFSGSAGQALVLKNKACPAEPENPVKYFNLSLLGSTYSPKNSSFFGIIYPSIL